MYYQINKVAAGYNIELQKGEHYPQTYIDIILRKMEFLKHGRIIV